MTPLCSACRGEIISALHPCCSRDWCRACLEDHRNEDECADPDVLADRAAELADAVEVGR